MDRPSDVDVLGLATAVFLALVAALGPLAIQDEPLDLGGGIAMRPDGTFLVSGSQPPGAMHIPDESEYNGQAPASSGSAPPRAAGVEAIVGTVAGLSAPAFGPYDLLGDASPRRR